MGYSSTIQDPQDHRAQGLAQVCRKLTRVGGGELEKGWQGPRDQPCHVPHKQPPRVPMLCPAALLLEVSEAKPGFWGIKWFSTRSHIRITYLQSILQ